MEATQTLQLETVDEIYSHAASLLVNEKRTGSEVIQVLVNKGLNNEKASAMVLDLQNELTRIKKDRAKKDMLYGSLWCVGGIIATIAGKGYFFWGAILFGAIQLIRGIMNSSK